METIECQVCDEVVDLSTVWSTDKVLRLFCSRSCAGRARGTFSTRSKTRETYRSAPSKHKDGRYSSCLRCGTDTDHDHNALFCSRSCKELFWPEYDKWVANDKPPREYTKKPKESLKTKKCPHCTTMIWPKSSTCRKHRDKSVYEGRRVRGLGVHKTPNQMIEDWLSGKIKGNQGPKTPCVVHPIIRNYLYEEANFSCTSCGFREVHPIDGNPILNLNHIDGDASNHSRSNLEVLCPNCHAMTPNYGSRNKNSSRTRIQTEVKVD